MGVKDGQFWGRISPSMRGEVWFVSFEVDDETVQFCLGGGRRGLKKEIGRECHLRQRMSHLVMVEVVKALAADTTSCSTAKGMPTKYAIRWQKYLQRRSPSASQPKAVLGGSSPCVQAWRDDGLRITSANSRPTDSVALTEVSSCATSQFD
ncbi:unnamed protein product [Hydatigera taeniaeformis]|uniref:Uncharacterized protein n=1 Tax=Hydatigena taeniaeformis TaxID=6205 RepID=A0A0R3X8Z9_HYDTA|nr:unnamed protein product [Hydatigera taeniaeformis]